MSTRGDRTKKTFSEVILEGIAPDGGLYVPKKIPSITPQELRAMEKATYQEIAGFLFRKFETDFSNARIDAIVDEAYSKNNFDSEEIAPLISSGSNTYILELWHGPTAAFKDMALQIMPHFFSEAIQMENKKRIERMKAPLRYTILVATSGDTGKAALEGFKNRELVQIIVFYPKNGVSELQEKQMITQEGKNVHVIAVEGNFDDIQSAVKETFNDEYFVTGLREQKCMNLSSANSINWGRLLPQIVYYFSAYAILLQRNVRKIGEEFSVAVPTGNFGNILAAYYAKKMGLPIAHFICATNENNVVSEFLKTGVYDIRDRTFQNTPSPAMDILISSNIERFLFEITRSHTKVREWMEDLKNNRYFEVDGKTKKEILSLFSSGTTENELTLKTIRNLYQKKQYVIDPHTAVAYHVVQNYETKEPVIIASTANWAKFGTNVYRALQGIPYHSPLSHSVHNYSEIDLLREIEGNFSGAQIPKNIAALEQKPPRHKSNIGKGKEELQKAVLEKILGNR